MVYKLTDFGYSKSYDQNSVCTSLVGTMQYVVSLCVCNVCLSSGNTYVVSVSTGHNAIYGEFNVWCMSVCFTQ